MAMFNLNDYETVEERLKRFWANEAHNDARLVTFNRTTPEDRTKGIWVIEARLYLTANDQAMDLPKTTGWAFEIDGGAGANKTSALENAETSSLGRCLANYSMSGNKRASREEMEKVQRETLQVKEPIVMRNWQAEIDALKDRDAALQLFNEARTQKAGQKILDAIENKGKEITGKK